MSMLEMTNMHRSTSDSVTDGGHAGVRFTMYGTIFVDSQIQERSRPTTATAASLAGPEH
jgi:hypothetical protein